MNPILTQSDDKNAFQVGVLVMENAMSFWIKFYLYDEVAADYDYPIEKSFSMTVTPSVDITVTFAYQVMLSIRRPPEEIRIDHLAEIDTSFGFPSDAYAYTALDPIII